MSQDDGLQVSSQYQHLAKLEDGLQTQFGEKLYGAVLTGTDLSFEDLAGEDLRGAHLHGANLTGANLTGVKGYSPKRDKD